jgi:hypothetical protein
MGFLKKLTKPLSKFLDKIIPNEIKPALPYLSAFAPFMMGPGIMGSSMLQRGLMSGGANLLSQLAQEGSEGDVDWLSAALAGGIGSLTAPGSAGKPISPRGQDLFRVQQTPSASQFLAGKADVMDPGWLKSGTEMLGKGAEYLGGAAKTLGPGGDPFSVEGLKAALVPATAGTADLARITAQQELDRLNEEEEETGIGINDEGRRRAIRAAMEAGGHGEEAILDALASVGLRSGGIVSLRDGGQLVKRGPGRPGYNGQGDYTPDRSPGRTAPGGGAGRDILTGQRNIGQTVAKRHVPTSITIGGDGITTNQPIKYGERYNPNLSFGSNIGKGLSTTDLAKLFTNYYQTPPVDETDPNTWNYGLQNITTPDVSVEDVTVTTPDSTIDEVTEVATDKNFLENIRDITNRTKDQLIEMEIAGQLKKGGRVGLLRGGDPDDYPQQEDDVTPWQLQQEEGVPIGPMVQEDRQKQLLKAFAEYQAGGGTLSLKEFAVMWMRKNAAGGGVMGVLPKGTEADYRGGGVIPIGSRERADDVPARLSKNEFVMTADAVKAAGGGNVNKGAKKMYNLMHNLEARV